MPNKYEDNEIIVSAAVSGMRLDVAIHKSLPGLGLRACRRLFDWYGIYVDGIRRNMSFKVKEGSFISIKPLKEGSKEFRINDYLVDNQENRLTKEYEADYVPKSVVDSALQLPKQAIRDIKKDSITITNQQKIITEAHKNLSPMFSSIKIIELSKDLVALSKPSGLHSVSIKGSPELSCEGFINTNWNILVKEFIKNNKDASGLYHIWLNPPCLVTRLDKETSGILLGKNLSKKEQIHEFRLNESLRKVDKYYFAIVAGKLDYNLKITVKLNVSNSKITVPLKVEDIDLSRHTIVTPVAVFLLEDDALNLSEGYIDNKKNNGELGSALSSFKECTLVKVNISKGARHQIRCHLAYAGYPILGDDKYTKSSNSNAGEIKFIKLLNKVNLKTINKSIYLKNISNQLMLHHSQVSYGSFNATYLPEWGDIKSYCSI